MAKYYDSSGKTCAAKSAVYCIVVKGDTLSAIALAALGSGSKYTQLATLNKLSNPNVISIGQKIILRGSSSSSSSSSKNKTNSNQVELTVFGLSTSADNTLVAAWNWGKNNTENYEIQWLYYTGDRDKNDKAIWFGSKSTVDVKNSTFSIPDRTVQIKFNVKPVSKTYQVSDKNGKTTTKTHFDGEYLSNWQYYNHKPAPDKPGTPTVTIEKLKVTAVVDGIDIKALGDPTHIEFQVTKDDKIYGSTKRVAIDTTLNRVSTFWNNVSEGGKYRIRCRSYKNGLTSDWSAFSSEVVSRPSAPEGFIDCISKKSSVTGKISVYLSWKAVSSATGYEIQYTTDKSYFDVTDKVTTVPVENVTKWEFIDLESGQTYYFRLRAKSDSKDPSNWSGIADVSLGEPPGPPTTWSSVSASTVGKPLYLYWVHNSKDGSSQTAAQIWLELWVKGELHSTRTIEQANSTDIDERDKTSSFDLTSWLQENVPDLYIDGLTIKWRIRTAGITEELDDINGWSVIREIDIHAMSKVSLTVTDSTNAVIGIDTTELTSFPIKVSASTSPETQNPIGFYLNIVPKENYTTIDQVTKKEIVILENEELYSKHFDVNSNLEDIKISAGDVDLENGVTYALSCIASMDSGLTATGSVEFIVAWDDTVYIPEADVTYYPETVTADIRPYCYDYTYTYYKVTKTGSKYYLTDELIDTTLGDPIGEPVNNIYTTTGEQVYSGTTAITISDNENGEASITGGDSIYYHIVRTGIPVEGIFLSVYRREFDGTFTEIATDIDNSKNTVVTDPHPALDAARYRIVARTESTGAIGFYDMPGIPINETAIVIQWAEEWSTFDLLADDPQAEPNGSASLLRLPYNVDVSDKYAMDASLVKYAGRKRPVSYYGTHLGESASWSVDIPKDDKETLYALRRLAIWTGDVYVREPSGTGYWANISVSFSQTHREVTIPVSLEITRVEGGM